MMVSHTNRTVIKKAFGFDDDTLARISSKCIIITYYVSIEQEERCIPVNPQKD